MSVVPTDMLVPVANGGTGAATKSGAVTNLLKYTVTKANCDNTTTETTVMSVTIPANTWSDGEDVIASLISKHKQAAGSARTLTLKVKVNGTSITLLSASSISSSATEGQSRRTFNFTRVGSEIWAYFNATNHGAFGSTTTPGTAAIGTITYSGDNSVGAIWEGIDFTADVTLTYTVQWGAAANAATYFRPVAATCIKI